MTQYLLSVHSVEGTEPPSAEDIRQMYADVEVFNAELRATGAWVFAGGLHPSDTATVVRVTSGQVVMTDGPFAETQEMLAGFYLLEAKDLNEAIRLASGIPPAKHGSIEVRPVRALQVAE
jgi:hypothetical protein